MKNRVTVEICGKEFALVADESELYMKSISAEVNQMINEIIYKNIRTSKNDAALLICLDLCDKNKKLTEANDNMREQVTTYAEEINNLKKQLAASNNSKSEDLSEDTAESESETDIIEDNENLTESETDKDITESDNSEKDNNSVLSEEQNESRNESSVENLRERYKKLQQKLQQNTTKS